MGIERIRAFLDFLWEVLPSPEQILVWILFSNPVTVVEALLAISCFLTGTGILKRGLALVPIYLPPKEVWFGYLKEGQSLPPVPSPIPVPAHAYWYHLIAGLIFIGLAIFFFWLLAGRGWF